MTQEIDELVKRLRGIPSALEADTIAALEAQAAEIERLRLEKEGALAIIATERAEVLKLRKEVARLRGALTDLEAKATETIRYGAVTGSHWSRLTSANLKARTALKGGE